MTGGAALPPRREQRGSPPPRQPSRLLAQCLISGRDGPACMLRSSAAHSRLPQTHVSRAPIASSSRPLPAPHPLHLSILGVCQPHVGFAAQRQLGVICRGGAGGEGRSRDTFITSRLQAHRRASSQAVEPQPADSRLSVLYSCTKGHAGNRLHTPTRAAGDRLCVY